MLRILYLTQSAVGDYSSGGAQRSNYLRSALNQAGDLNTLIINHGPRFMLESQWSSDRTRRATLARYGLSPASLRERMTVKRWIGQIWDDSTYDYIVSQYVDLAMLVPARLHDRMIFDPDDFHRFPPADASVSVRIKAALRNASARQLAACSAHVWFSNARYPPANPKRSLMPNVVAIPEQDRSRSKVIPGRVIMVGLFDHAPNAEGLRWFVADVWPALKAYFSEAELHAIGRASSELTASLPQVAFRGYVDDLASEYDKAALVVAPVRSGGGTQIKLIEALAHGRPLVASAFAHEGFIDDLISGVHLFTAECSSEWIVACSDVLADPDVANNIAARGAAAVRVAYGPHRMVSEVASTFAALTSPHTKLRRG